MRACLTASSEASISRTSRVRSPPPLLPLPSLPFAVLTQRARSEKNKIVLPSGWTPSSMSDVGDYFKKEGQVRRELTKMRADDFADYAKNIRSNLFKSKKSAQSGTRDPRFEFEEEEDEDDNKHSRSNNSSDEAKSDAEDSSDSDAIPSAANRKKKRRRGI